jgi:hypothetical protein
MLKLAQVLVGWNPREGGAVREPIVLLEAGWAEIVGAEVAQHSRPEKIAAGTLTVTTRSNAWSQQLSFLSEHVLRAVAARIPAAGVTELRFRVGRLAVRRPPIAGRRPSSTSRPPSTRPDSATSAEALARFRRGVEERLRARHSAGYRECAVCGALVVCGPKALCATCAAARSRDLEAATARLLFEAPWLGYGGTAALVSGLQEEEYRRVRTRLLARWWGMLARARETKQLSRDGRERSIASSYVLLRSKIAPEEIMPETVRNVLGDELHELLYGCAPVKGGSIRNRKRRT